MKSPTSDDPRFCDEPWIGVLSIETNLDVTFCPCFMKLRIGSLRGSSLPELWNSEPIVALRRSFAKGELPEACRGKLCPSALAHEAE